MLLDKYGWKPSFSKADEVFCQVWQLFKWLKLSVLCQAAYKPCQTETASRFGLIVQGEERPNCGEVIV